MITLLTRKFLLGNPREIREFKFRVGGGHPELKIDDIIFMSRVGSY